MPTLEMMWDRDARIAALETENKKLKLAGQFDEQEQRNAEERLMRLHLGLNPCHSLLNAVRVLHDDGREAFEKLRGPRCEYAHEWKPRASK